MLLLYTHIRLIAKKRLFVLKDMSSEKKVFNMLMKPKNITGIEAMILVLALMITAAAFSFIVFNMGLLSN